MTKHAIPNDRNMGIGEISEQEVSRLAPDNPHQAFVVSDLGRPGVGEFLQEVEYELYTPDTPSNVLFEMLIIEREGMRFVAVAFPMKDLERVRQIAAQFDIRIEQGTWVMMGPNGITTCPIGDHPNTFIVQGVCTRLKDLPLAETNRLFTQREEELKRQYGLMESPQKA